MAVALPIGGQLVAAHFVVVVPSHLRLRSLVLLLSGEGFGFGHDNLALRRQRTDWRPEEDLHSTWSWASYGVGAHSRH